MQKILLADDSNVAQRMGKEILSAEGFEVVTVSNGQAAVKWLKDGVPALILADIFMPAKSGYEVCEYVRSQEHLKKIPVVLLVGAMEPYDPEEGRKVKADGVITKPLQSSSLIKIVKDLVATVAPPPPPPPPPPAPIVEQVVPVEEEPEELSSKEALEISQEVANQPISAFEDLLESPAEPDAKLESLIEASEEPASPDTSFPGFPSASGSAVEEEPAQALYPPFPSTPEPAEATFSPHAVSSETEASSPIFPPFPASPETEISLPDLSGGAVAFEEAPIELNQLALEASDQPVVESLPELAAEPSAAAAAEPVEMLESEQPPTAEAIEPELQQPERIIWTAESAAVTPEDEKSFDEPQPSSDWSGLTKLVEEEAGASSAGAFPWDHTEAAAAIVPEIETAVDQSASAEPMPGEPASEPVQADAALEPVQAEAAADDSFTLQLDQPDADIEFLPVPLEDADPEPVSIASEAAEVAKKVSSDDDSARIQHLIRLSVEEMMPQIVDRIVRSVTIVLNREEK